MAKDITFLDLVDEVLAEEMEIIQEVLVEEIAPLVKYRKDLETKITNKAISEMYRLESEAAGKIEKEKAYNWLNR